MRIMGKKSLIRYVPSGAFAQHAMAACYSLSASLNTRRAYWTDVRRWLEFCDRRGLEPFRPPEIAVAMWVEQMKLDNEAPKTRSRRVSALSSIYDQLRRQKVVDVNPFSVDVGPKRERALAIKPTPAASADAVLAIAEACADGTPEGLRDEAIVRILWATGARRASVAGMTHERLQREGKDFVALLRAKGDKDVRVLIRGRAAEALHRWLTVAPPGRRGHLWCSTSGAALVEKDIWKIVRSRARQAGIEESITPHTFRVSFLTINPAALDAKQDAAGHADPATTRLYDRKWRGREAFELMPEIEDAVKNAH
jgi:integrase/recombinase XerD